MATNYTPPTTERLAEIDMYDVTVDVTRYDRDGVAEFGCASVRYPHVSASLYSSPGGRTKHATVNVHAAAPESADDCPPVVRVHTYEDGVTLIIRNPARGVAFELNMFGVSTDDILAALFQAVEIPS